VSGLLECIMCSNNDDGPRFIEFFEDKIKQGLIERTKLFDVTKVKIRTLADEKDEAKQEKKKLKEKKAKKGGPGDMAGLEAMILAKKNAGGGFMAYMENKYGGDEPEPAPKKKGVKRN
jgi:hypothetical protein